MTLIDFFDRGLMLSRHLPCLVEDGLSLTYCDVAGWSHRIAWALSREGFGPQSRIAVLSYNGVWPYVALLGLQRARCVWIPLNARSKLEENVRHLQRTGAEWLFFHSDFAEQAEAVRAQVGTLKGMVCLDRAEASAPSLADWAGDEARPFPLPDVDPVNDIFRITSSGGTTGEPKAIVQTQRGVEAGVAMFLALLRFDGRPRHLLCNPMTHAAGIISYHVLAAGGTIFLLRSPDLPQVIEQIERHRIQMLMLTPTSLYALLARSGLSEHDFSSLRYLTIGAAPLSAAKLRQAIELFGPVVMQAYGQSEASPVVALMMPEDYAEAVRDPNLAHRLQSCGRATPFSRLAVIGQDGTLLPQGERGEIVVRSNVVMRGYWQDGKVADWTSNWHGTGDVAYLDEDGYIFIVDRIRDLIITGGFNVFPSEVEQVIWSHPLVEDCAVVGLPDEKWGEAVHAVVALKQGAALTEEEVIGLCKERLGSVKAPKAVEFWDSLPKSALGKVLKREVRGVLLTRASARAPA